MSHNLTDKFNPTKADDLTLVGKFAAAVVGPMDGLKISAAPVPTSEPNGPF